MKKKIQRFFLYLSIILVLTIFYFLFFQGEGPKSLKTSNEDSYLIKPYFRGIADDKNIYEINADKAVQVGESQYFLQQVFLKYYLDNSHSQYISVFSTEGKMDESSSIFQFINNVEIIYSIGYRGVTDKIDVNFKNMIANADSKFIITGAKAKITGENGMIFKIKEKDLTFKGPVKTVLINQKL